MLRLGIPICFNFRFLFSFRCQFWSVLYFLHHAAVFLNGFVVFFSSKPPRLGKFFSPLGENEKFQSIIDYMSAWTTKMIDGGVTCDRELETPKKETLARSPVTVKTRDSGVSWRGDDESCHEEIQLPSSESNATLRCDAKDLSNEVLRTFDIQPMREASLEWTRKIPSLNFRLRHSDTAPCSSITSIYSSVSVSETQSISHFGLC